MERQIVNARLVRFALEGHRLSRRQLERIAETTLNRRKQRLYLRFGGQPPKHWHSLHYARLIEAAAKGIRVEFGI